MFSFFCGFPIDTDDLWFVTSFFSLPFCIFVLREKDLNFHILLVWKFMKNEKLDSTLPRMKDKSVF